MLSDHIIESEFALFADAEELRNSPYPLVMLGTSNCAEAVYSVLQSLNLKVDHFVVSDEFYDSNPGLNFHGTKVLPLGRCLDEYREVNLILASSLYTPKDERINKTYFYFIHVSTKIINRGSCLVLNALYERLADDKSRRVLAAYLNKWISGKAGYTAEVSPYLEQYVDEIMEFQDDEIIVDCGAYNGDTIRKYAQKHKYKLIYALEPDKSNFKALQNNTKHMSNIVYLAVGAWDRSDVLSFVSRSNATSFLGEVGKSSVDVSNDSIKVDTIDNILHGDAATIIKMDIEGAELQALRGAEQTIRKYKPKLAICVYHSADDLFKIPEYILSLNGAYKLYLRMYTPSLLDLVLYAV